MFHLTPTSVFSNFCGLRISVAGRQRAELVAGRGQIGDAVGGVDRQIVDRLHDDGGARRDLFVDPVARECWCS